MSTLLLAQGDDAVGLNTVTRAIDSPAVTAALTNPVTELALATAILVPVIVIHGWSIGQVSKLFSARFALYRPSTPRWRVTALTSITVAILVIIHLVETVLWTFPLIVLGMIDNFRDAYYYVLECYTTLGEGTVTLPDQWRLIGPVIAITGLFTFGWTGSVLVYVMTEIGKLHAERSKDEARTGTGAVPNGHA